MNKTSLSIQGMVLENATLLRGVQTAIHCSSFSSMWVDFSYPFLHRL